MADLKTYTGGCHCGAVRYEVDLALERLIACNCSICSKTGSLLAFAPATQFRLLSGGESLSDYQFNKHIIHHLFCKNCGIRSFARGMSPSGQETVAINARCLDELDTGSVPIVNYDGKSR